MELEAVTGKGLWGHKGPGSRLACSLYLPRWIEQLSACQLADRLMRTLSHSTQWRKGPYCLTSLIVEPAHISEPACRGPGCPSPHPPTPTPPVFSFAPSLSLCLNFFFLLYFLLHPAHCLNPLTHIWLHYFAPLLPPPIICHLSLPSVSHFSKWWVLAHDRLGQVCLNYSKRDGDITGEEEAENFFAHIIF